MPSVGAARRAQERRRTIAAQEAENEIWPIPPIYNPARRIACQRDPILWLNTYLPEVFFVPFSESQKRFINICWQTISANGSKAIEAYRGFGKTSILSGLMLACIMTGRIRHAVYIVAEGGRMTKQASQWFQAALYEEYDRTPAESKPLAADYPEICYPIQRRRGVANKPLRYRGEPVDIVISPEKIQFPTIPGSPASGSLLTFASIHSPIRGAAHQIRGAGSFRVGAVMLDDIQTDENANSEKETDNIIQTVKSSIAFLSGKTADGAKEPLIVLSAITQNRPGDVAERLRLEVPELNTVTIPFLKRTPADFSAWKKYRERRAEIYRENRDDAEEARRLINLYYRANAPEIERDAEPDDDRIKEPGQLSAVQYALEKWCNSERAFWSELQNDATRAAQEEDGGLAPITVLRKRRQVEGQPGRYYRRYEVPHWAEILTAHIDAGEHYLNFEVVAFAADASASAVVDFGIWPEQNFPTTSKKHYHRDLQEVYRRGDKYDRLSAAVCDCLRSIVETPYFNVDGERVDIDAPTRFYSFVGGRRRVFPRLAIIGVDAGDGEMSPAIWDAVARFHRIDDGRYFGRACPCYGTSASTRLLRYYDLKPGEWRRGGVKSGSNCDWIENPASRRDELGKYAADVPRCFLFDANTYKTRREEAWRAPLDRPGAASLFDGGDPETMRMFAEQQTAEEVTAERRLSDQIYKIWAMKKPRIYDNEFLDTDTAARALAHYVGIEAEIGRPAPRRIKWV